MIKNPNDPLLLSVPIDLLPLSVSIDLLPAPVPLHFVAPPSVAMYNFLSLNALDRSASYSRFVA